MPFYSQSCWIPINMIFSYLTNQPNALIKIHLIHHVLASSKMFFLYYVYQKDFLMSSCLKIN